MKQYNRTGIVLILIGVYLLFNQFGLLPDLDKLIPLLIGLVFLGVYFFAGQPWAIFPGAFLTGLGAGVAVAEYFSWAGRAQGAVMFYGFSLAFLLIWALGKGHSWAAWPATVFGFLATGLLFMRYDVLPEEVVGWLRILFWPSVLIFLGVRGLIKRDE